METLTYGYVLAQALDARQVIGRTTYYLWFRAVSPLSEQDRKRYIRKSTHRRRFPAVRHKPQSLVNLLEGLNNLECKLAVWTGSTLKLISAVGTSTQIRCGDNAGSQMSQQLVQQRVSVPRTLRLASTTAMKTCSLSATDSWAFGVRNEIDTRELLPTHGVVTLWVR